MPVKETFKKSDSSEKNGALFLQGPDKCILALWKRTPGYIKLTFACAFLLGLAVHFYAFSRKLPNHDDIGHLFGSEYGVESGRWLLPFVLKLDGSFSTPWLIGVISLVMLALACCFAVSVLGIRRPLGCILTAFVMVSFPGVTSTISYMFSADAYFLSLALACFAAFAVIRLKYGVFYAVFAIVLSMAVYQGYFGVTAFLLVGSLLFGILDGKMTAGTALRNGLKFFLVLLVSMLLYLVTVEISTSKTGLVEYMGISDMGAVSFSKLPELIKNAYFAYFDFFISDVYAVHAQFMKYAFIVCFFLCAALTAVILKRRKPGAAAVSLAVFLLLIYPLAGNLIYIMAPEATAHMLMIYGMICALIAPAALMERCEREGAKGREKGFFSISCWIIAVTIAASAYGYSVLANEAYLKMELSYEQAYSFSTRLIGAVESTEGYEKNIPIVLIGKALGGIEYGPSPELDRISLTGISDAGDIINSYSYGYFLRRFVGSPNIIFVSGSELSKELEERESVKNMPEYPALGSIRTIDGRIIVKLG